MPQSKDFISIRLDEGLKAELQQAAELEQRSLSNFGRLLIEYAWGQYLRAGSMRELIEEALDRSSNGRTTGTGNATRAGGNLQPGARRRA
jgi:hypothetical protein